MRTSEVYQHVLSALHAGTMEALLKAAYEILKMPVTVADANFMILGIYPQRKTGDKQWDANRVSQQISAEYIHIFQADEHLRVLQEAKNAVYIDWGYFHDHPRYSCLILSRDQVLGYFAALAINVKRQGWHIEAIKIIAQALAVFMELHHTKRRSRDQNPEMLLQGLLSGSIETADELDRLQSITSTAMKPGFVLLAVKTRNRLDMPLASYLGEQFSCNFDGSYKTVFGNCLYVLLTGMKKDFLSQHTFRKAVHNLKGGNAVCGISRLFSNPLLMPQYKWQADTALEVGYSLQPQRTIHLYDSYFVNIVADVVMKTIPPGNCIHPALYDLATYDSLHNTDYLETLEAYILCFLDSGATAARLCIHRNTLLYRLDKIKEITGIDSFAGKTVIHLFLSFLLHAHEPGSAKGLQLFGQTC